ncbi:MAG: hypothetical protein K2P86_03685 [Xanthobacteraceae bacterium]|jgi:hypothetical protein|nr:hypothetical protein [Xanthobacteraceae bacterium]
MRLSVLLAGIGFLLGGFSAHAKDAEAAGYLSKYDVPLPTASEVVVCHGFGCKYRTPVTLGSADIARLREILKRGQRSANDEIDAIANAIAWFERRIGPITGTSRRTPRAGPDQAGIRTEADCIDESVNTTVLLLLISRLNLLKHHEVVGPESRGYLVDMRYPHTTAVVVNLRNGSRWAIDPWTKRNGERPDTLPLARWMQGS